MLALKCKGFAILASVLYMSALKIGIPITLLHLNYKYINIQLKKYGLFLPQVVSRAINYAFLIIHRYLCSVH